MRCLNTITLNGSFSPNNLEKFGTVWFAYIRQIENTDMIIMHTRHDLHDLTLRIVRPCWNQPTMGSYIFRFWYLFVHFLYRFG